MEIAENQRIQNGDDESQVGVELAMFGILKDLLNKYVTGDCRDQVKKES